MNKKTYLNMNGLFLCFFIILVLTVSAIISLAQEQDNTWAKIYESSTDNVKTYDKATSIIKASDENYLIAGFTKLNLEKKIISNLAILKIDTYGNIIWSTKTIEKVGRLILPGFKAEIIALKNGGYAAVYAQFLIRLDDNGNILWIKKFGTNKTEQSLEFTSIQELDDSGFITCGSTYSPDEYKTLVMKLNKFGNIIWSNSYFGFISEYARIRKLDDGGFILGNAISGLHFPNIIGHVTQLTKLDAEGNVEWQKLYDPTHGAYSTNRGFSTFCLTKNKEIITTIPDAVGGRYRGCLILKLSPEGDFIWSKLLTHPVANPITIKDIRCLENGDLILVGEADQNINPGGGGEVHNLNTFALKMDQNGNIFWLKTLGKSPKMLDRDRNQDEYALSVEVSDRGEILYVGTCSSFSSIPDAYNFIAVKMNLDGEVSNGGYYLRNVDLNDKRRIEITSPSELDVKEFRNESKEIKNMNVYDMTDFDFTQGTFSEKNLPKPELKLALSDRGRTLTSNLPIFVKEDEVDNSEIDSDGDGIVQEWEDMAMDYINPYIELDEEEDWLIRRNTPHIVLAKMDTNILIPSAVAELGESALEKYGEFAQRIIPPLVAELGESALEKYDELGLITTATDHVANFVRVHPYPDFYDVPNFNYHSTNLPQYIIFRYVVTWSFDYGRFGVMGHHGDHERIFMAWKVIDDKTLRLEWVFTSSHRDPNAHHGVWNAWYSVCNKGDVALTNERTAHSEVMCSNLQFVNNRLLVCASEDKHAIYPSCEVCEDVKLFVDIAGEDCGEGGRFRFDCYNVGEPPDFIDPKVYDLSLDKGKLVEEFPKIDYDIRKFINKLSSRYRIQIETGNEELAGTDAKISIKLFGSEGTSPWYEIYSAPQPPSGITIEHLGTFEKGDTDNIYINSLDLGEVFQIQIKHDNSGLGPGWYISEIWVEDLETNATWHSRPNTWLDKVLWNDSTDKTFNLE
jgi:hypothetical protein